MWSRFIRNPFRKSNICAAFAFFFPRCLFLHFFPRCLFLRFFLKQFKEFREVKDTNKIIANVLGYVLKEPPLHETLEAREFISMAKKERKHFVLFAINVFPTGETLYFIQYFPWEICISCKSVFFLVAFYCFLLRVSLISAANSFRM